MPKIADVLRGAFTGQDIELRGWIYRTRTIGGKAFVVLRDSSGVLQVALSKESLPPEQFEAAEKALIESAVTAKGTVVQDKRAPGGYEVRAKEFHVVSYAEKFPIQQDLSEEFLLDVRHLWVRSQRMASIFRVRHTVFGAVHEYFRGEGFFEVHPPMITSVGSEGGSTLFEVEYFGKKAHLTQSWQLYAEALALSMEKVYYVGPSFRAEKSRTSRHLTEFWHCEMEEAWAGMDDVLKRAEGAVAHAAHRAAEDNPDDLAFLGRDPEVLKRVHAPFERIT
ncbi:MAG: amino acid--tRNA ligase-related protein, partial [Candidatus Thermoplasmatota archaeon]